MVYKGLSLFCLYSETIGTQTRGLLNERRSTVAMLSSECCSCPVQLCYQPPYLVRSLLYFPFFNYNAAQMGYLRRGRAPAWPISLSWSERVGGWRRCRFRRSAEGHLLKLRRRRRCSRPSCP